MRAANSIGEHPAPECPSPVRTSGATGPAKLKARPDVDPESDPGLWGEAARRSRLFHAREFRVRYWFVIPMFSFGEFCAGSVEAAN
jgi:hypothetical protein